MRFEDSTPNPGIGEKLLKLVTCMLNKIVSIVLHQTLELSFEI